jgi:hypothetical protein
VASGESGFDIGGVARKNHADGKLAIVRGVGRIKRAGAEIEADLTAKGFLEQRFQFAMGGKAFVVQRRLVHEVGDM